MRTIYLVYKTDNLHSFASRDVIGVCGDRTVCMYVIVQKAEKEGEELSLDQKHNIAELNQTQGYSGDGEFVIEQVMMNTLL